MWLCFDDCVGVQFLPVVEGKGSNSQEKQQLNNVMSKVLAANNHDVLNVSKVWEYEDL